MVENESYAPLVRGDLAASSSLFPVFGGPLHGLVLDGLVL